MPCKLSYNEDGTLFTAICGPGVKNDPCDTANCSKPHTKLCDFPLGGKKLGQTCDKLMCDSHANPFDVAFLSEDVRARVQEHDTFDLCDAHYRFVTKVKKS